MVRINFNEPRFDSSDLESVSEVIKDNFVNEGPKTKELASRLEEILSVKHVILTTNATAALFLAIKAESILREKEDFEVIVPDMTMFATATSVEWAGGNPILVDVDSAGKIDLDKIKDKINDKTIAIMPVHMLGRGVNINELKKIAKEKNLAIVEDAAGALGSKQDGTHLGTLGDVGCFSLQSNKIITCGQGGIISTNDSERYEIMKRLIDFGRLNKKEFLHNTVGFNLKFSDLQAALTLSQLEKLENRKDLLKKQYEIYKKELASLGQIKFFDYNEEEVPLWIDVECVDRENLLGFLKESEIFPRPCWPAIHQNPPYQDQGTDEVFPNASNFAKNVLWLPNGPAISGEQIKLVCDKIKDFYMRDNND